MSEIQQRDDRLDAITAIEQANEPGERRSATRIRRRVATQVVPWSVGVPAVPFQAVIEDISETGIGFLHDEPVAKGAKFLVTVPRAHLDPLVIECTAVRCEQRGHRLYKIGLQSNTPIDHVEEALKTLRLTSKRTKILFLVFGIVGLLVAIFVPL